MLKQIVKTVLEPYLKRKSGIPSCKKTIATLEADRPDKQHYEKNYHSPASLLQSYRH